MLLGFSGQAVAGLRDLEFPGGNSGVAQTDGIPQESKMANKAGAEFTGMTNSMIQSVTCYHSYKFHANSCPSFFLLWL